MVEEMNSLSFSTGMTWAVVFAVFLLTIKPMGTYMAKVFTFQPTLLDKPLSKVENWTFRMFGISRDSSMTAMQYGAAFLLTNLLWAILAYAMLRMQTIFAI